MSEPIRININWNRWLNEYVCMDPEDYVRRRVAIHRLCSYGLIPFLRANGYSIAISNKELGSRIATGLYNNHGRHMLESDWSFGPIENTCMNDDYRAHFHHVINDAKWEVFWEQWGGWLDQHRHADIQDYIWSQVCSEHSPETEIANEHIYGEEEYAAEHDSRDVYLKDSIESNEWGGIRKR